MTDFEMIIEQHRDEEKGVVNEVTRLILTNKMLVKEVAKREK